MTPIADTRISSRAEILSCGGEPTDQRRETKLRSCRDVRSNRDLRSNLSSKHGKTLSLTLPVWPRPRHDLCLKFQGGPDSASMLGLISWLNPLARLWEDFRCSRCFAPASWLRLPRPARRRLPDRDCREQSRGVQRRLYRPRRCARKICAAAGERRRYVSSGPLRADQ